MTLDVTKNQEGQNQGLGEGEQVQVLTTVWSDRLDIGFSRPSLILRCPACLRSPDVDSGHLAVMCVSHNSAFVSAFPSR